MTVKSAGGIHSFSNIFGKKSEACFQGLAVFQKWFVPYLSPSRISLYIVDILGKDGTFSLSVMPNQLESSLSQNGSWESGRKRENDSYGGGGKSKKILPRVSFSYLKSPYPFTQHLCHMYQPIDWRNRESLFCFLEGKC